MAANREQKIDMKKFLTILLLGIIHFTAHAQGDNPQYNARLADSLGGDERGMKMYVLVILKTGTYKTEDKKITDSLFKGHMDNIGRLVAAGKLVVAGPLGKNSLTYRGIFIFNVKTVAEAQALLITDPAVHSKLLDAEIIEWYGSAALPMYLPYHDKVQQKKM